MTAEMTLGWCAVSETGDAALTVRLEAIQSLANVPWTALPLGVNAVYMGTDGILAISRPPRSSRLKFFVENLHFNVAVSLEGEQAVCQIWAEIGYIPYTVESPQRRRQILSILRASQGLPHARFVVENGQKILLISDSRSHDAVTVDHLIYEAVQLVQEARPFLRLIAEQMTSG